MSEFTIHTVDTAPQGSRQILQNSEKELGYITNLFGVMAESPATLEAYQSLSALFDKTVFTVTERQLVLLSISRLRNCAYCLAAHGTIAKKQRIPSDIIHAVYYNQTLEDTKLETLRNFTRKVVEANGWVDKHALQLFYQAGYQQQHVLEVVLAISFKALSNTINLINYTPIDAEFLAGIPDSNQHKPGTIT